MVTQMKNTTQSTTQLQIFFDGGCKVCAWEVKKYLAADTLGRLGTIDINAPEFQAEKYGLDREKVQKYFHVLTSEGKVISGVDAFIEIWKVLDTPLSSLASKLGKRAPIHALLSLGYRGFVSVRPYLPRNKELVCTDGTCTISHHKYNQKKAL